MQASAIAIELPISDGDATSAGQPVAAPMAGQNIICFAKDWSETPTSNNHVMAELAKSNKVLWINSVGTRAPKFTSGRDIKKIFRKLGSFFSGIKQARPNLWIFTPIVLPMPNSSVARALNRVLLKLMIWRIRRQLGMKQFQLWSFIPSAADYVGTLGESMVIYYCTDEYSKFTYVDEKKTADAERKLIKACDLVFVTAQKLMADRLAINPETHLARHGVDRAMFAKAMDENTPLPADLTHIKKPILGFYGTIQDWIDFDLLCHLAERHPEWSIVMLGDVFVDVSRLKKYSNIHLLGRKEHGQLPNYCKGFDVGIIPYIINERILTVNPIKLREYMSAGLPVVSTAFPEVQLYPEFCTAANNSEEFEAAVQKALATDSPAARQKRSEAMREETWEKKVALLAQRVVQKLTQKNNTENSR